MCEGTDGVAGIRSREGASSERLGSYAPRMGRRMRSLLCLLLVLGEVGVADVVAGEGKLLLEGARVAREETRRHDDRGQSGRIILLQVQLRHLVGSSSGARDHGGNGMMVHARQACGWHLQSRGQFSRHNRDMIAEDSGHWRQTMGRG